MSRTDVVVIGGGIGGLYLAWRLRDTGLKISLLEKYDRFGGRIYSIDVPGGFIAEMGAMRFLPKSHILLQHLINNFSLETEPLFVNKRGLENKITHYFRNKHVNQQQLNEMCNIRESDNKYNLSHPTFYSDLQTADGNSYHAVLPDGRKAKDISSSEYISRAGNAELFHTHFDHYSESISVADDHMFLKLFSTFDETGYITLKNGMRSLVDKLVADLITHPNVKLLANHNVTNLVESGTGFLIGYNHSDRKESLTAKHCVIACNYCGLRYIQLRFLLDREKYLWSILENYSLESGFKLFLTYPSAWWEESGFYSGCLKTDLPIGQVISFGDRGKQGGYCTLLACFTYLYPEIFAGLNLPDADRDERLQTARESVKPSRRLVDYVHNQLKLIFDRSSIVEPIFGLTKLWNDDIVANYQSKIGNDASQSQWKTLKPFSDINLYMTGDSAFAVDHRGAYIGWMEGSLINSERIVTNHFNQEPILPELKPSLLQPTSSKL